MVYGIVTKATLPFRGQVMSHKGKHTSGKGMGSLLLNTGGAGGASSYIDIDDYIETTGRNPYGSKGQGIKGLNELSQKLSKMSINPTSSIKRKNITMNF